MHTRRLLHHINRPSHLLSQINRLISVVPSRGQCGQILSVPRSSQMQNQTIFTRGHRCVAIIRTLISAAIYLDQVQKKNVERINLGLCANLCTESTSKFHTRLVMTQI